jgi:hypothetical protein
MVSYVLAQSKYFTDEDKAAVVDALADDLMTPPGTAPLEGLTPELEMKMRYTYVETMNFLKDVLQTPVEENDLWRRFRARFPRSPLDKRQFLAIGTALAEMSVVTKAP